MYLQHLCKKGGGCSKLRQIKREAITNSFSIFVFLFDSKRGEAVNEIHDFDNDINRNKQKNNNENI